MKGTSHTIIGAMAGLTAVWYTDTLSRWPLVVAAVAVAAVAALLPDLDGTDSTARTGVGLGKQQIKREWRKRPRLSLIARRIASIPLNIFARLVPHRGPTHWILTAVILWGVVAYAATLFNLPPVLWVAFGAGYMSHLLADALTVAGVPLLGPLSGRSVRFIPRPIAIRTGGLAESLVVSLLMAGFMAVGMLAWLGAI
jgi:inner membrane protein